MSPKIIIALDFDNEFKALELLDSLDPSKVSVKIGSELFTRFGPAFVKTVISKGFKVFLDLKFHDIPNTVAASAKAAADLGVWMFNVHALGGSEMLEKTATALLEYGHDKPLLIAVTILTSMDDSEYECLGFNNTLDNQVVHLSALAQNAGLDGVVCSALDVKRIKQYCGSNYLAVTPGIRPDMNMLNDQSRVMTPYDAVQAGSDFLVIGRPVTRASNPQFVLQMILDSISC